MSDDLQVRVTRPLYGGDVLAEREGLAVPFAIPGELVVVRPGEAQPHILEPSPARVEPRCPHFTRCGGCQYQMLAADEQLRLKREILERLLGDAGIKSLPGAIRTHNGEPYGYRNRIRLRVERVDGALRFGYNVRASTQFLPIITCPIAAPLLWSAAEAILRVASDDRNTSTWLDASTEIELFGDDTLEHVQVTLLCPPRTRLSGESFAQTFAALRGSFPQIAGVSAIAIDPRTGPTGRTLATEGRTGLNYRVGDERYWISSGGFFQVNRFLLPQLVRLVCDGRSGALAWDLFAGVGLFSRILARRFGQVTAVEANPSAARDLRGALGRMGKQHRAVEATTLEFLRRALTERERPDLIVLDPPRAGAGEEAAALLGRFGAAEIVYVSCDPTTLARDWKVLEAHGYGAQSVDLVDMFPQTFHLETVVAFRRRS